MREIIQLTDEFEHYVGNELSVNRTDLAAMEQLILDGPLGPTDIARRLRVSTAAATTVVDRLEALGHVRREANPADRRGILVVPTPASVHKALDTLMPMIRGIDTTLDGFTETDQEVIARYLQRVVGVYRRVLFPDDAKRADAPSDSSP